MIQNDYTEVGTIIIGAGWCALYAAKMLKDNTEDFLIFEKRENLGGVWNFTDDTSIITVMEFTETTSSKKWTEHTDYPWKDSMGEFPTHYHILEYLNDFVHQYGLSRRIKYNYFVSHVNKTDGKWIVTVNDNIKYRANRIIIANGTHGKPNSIPKKIESFLEGDKERKLIHSSSIKTIEKIKPVIKNKTVLIVGGGETASDIALHLRPYCQSMVWSIENSVNFFKKRGRIFKKSPNVFAYDSMPPLFVLSCSKLYKGKKSYAPICRLTTSGLPYSHGGHAVNEWSQCNEETWGKTFWNKSADLLPLIKDGYIKAKGRIKYIKPGCFEFDDGSSSQVDVVIYCNGYKRNKISGIEISPEDCFMYTINPKDDSIAYMGFARPTISSIPKIAEFGCKLIEEIWFKKKKVNYAKLDRMALQFHDKQKKWRNSTTHLKTLVSPDLYVRFMMKLSLRLSYEIIKIVYVLSGKNIVCFIYNEYSKYHSILQLLDLNARYLSFNILRNISKLLPNKIKKSNKHYDLIKNRLAVALLFPDKYYANDKTIYLTENKYLDDELLRFYKSKGYQIKLI